MTTKKTSLESRKLPFTLQKEHLRLLCCGIVPITHWGDVKTCIALFVPLNDVFYLCRPERCFSSLSPERCLLSSSSWKMFFLFLSPWKMFFIFVPLKDVFISVPLKDVVIDYTVALLSIKNMNRHRFMKVTWRKNSCVIRSTQSL